MNDASRIRKEADSEPLQTTMTRPVSEIRTHRPKFQRANHLSTGIGSGEPGKQPNEIKLYLINPYL